MLITGWCNDLEIGRFLLWDKVADANITFIINIFLFKTVLSMHVRFGIGPKTIIKDHDGQSISEFGP